MKKLYYLCVILCLMLTLPVTAAEVKVTFADLALEGTNLVEMSPIDLNDDIQLVFEQGGAASAPSYRSSNGRVTLTMNAVMKVIGKTDKINITRISLTSPKASNTFSAGAASCVPEGTFTIDKSTLTNTWEDATGANSVQIVSTMGGPIFTDITIVYTSGEDTDDTDTPQTFATEFLALGLEGTNLVDMSSISLNDDLQLVFEKGDALAAPSYKSSNGRVTLTMNAVMKVIGKTDKINITRISLTSPKSSNTFSAGAASCIPEGTFTIDKSTLTNTWEDATGANSVQIVSTMGGPIFNAISVTYTGGKGGSEGPDNPDNPDDPDPDKKDANTFTTSFDSADDFSAMTVINTDDRTYTWRYEKSEKYVSIRNDFSSTASCPKDDYLVTPPMELKAGYNYRISFTAWCGNSDYPERVGAYIGKEATKEGLSINVIPETVVVNRSPETLSGVFTVETDGTYYAAIHASSEPGMFMLYVDDIEVSRPVLPAAPAEVTGLSVVPDASGALDVAVAFTAPDKAMDGSALTKPLIMTVKRDGNEIAVLQATPGQALSAADKVEAEGLHTYVVTPASADGMGFDTKSIVWVGVAAPSDPVSLSVEETSPGKLKFRWDAVTTNIYGHEIAPSQVTYTITSGFKVVGDGLTGTEAEVGYLAADDPQEITYFTIKARTSAGESANGASTPLVAVGTPYAMPYAENFPGGLLTEGQTAEVIADEVSSNTRWGYFEQLILDEIIPVTDDGGLMAFIGDMVGARSVFRTGKIHIDADASNPYLSFFYYTIPGASDSFEVAVNGNTEASLTINGAERGWKEALVSLAAYKGQDIRIALTGICANPDNKICVDNIAVRNEYSDDMAITRARIPYEMHQGVSHKCTIRVSNLGVNPSGSYTLQLLENGKEIGSAEGDGLKRGEIREYAFDVIPAAAGGETISYTALLNVAKDENESDNTVDVTTVVAANGLPAPTGLNANAGDDSFILSWDAVDMTALPDREITESFEAYDEFVTDRAGEWSFIDGDGCPVLGIVDGYHAYPNMHTPMAFMVFNNHDGFFPQIGTASFAPYHGGQCMMSASIDVINSSDRDNDDWLISPMLSGKAQTVSFYARSSGMVFPESFQVLYSTTDRLASSFVLIDSYQKAGAQWTRYEAALPDGAKYFAIRNVSHDAYMFFVDNVTFSAAPVETALVGYDVYAGTDAQEAGWRKLNAEPLTVTDLATSEIADGEMFRVEAVYGNGAKSVSEPYTIRTSGIDEAGVDADEEAEYYDMRGIRLAGKPTVGGLYIERRGVKSRTILIK